MTDVQSQGDRPFKPFFQIRNSHGLRGMKITRMLGDVPVCRILSVNLRQCDIVENVTGNRCLHRVV